MFVIQEKQLIVLLVLLIGSVFIINFSLMGLNHRGNFFIGSDGGNYVSFIETNTYQPLTTALLSFLVNPLKPQYFYFFHLILLFLLIPLLFFRLTNHWLSIPIYFSSYFVWASDNLGTIAQTLIVVLLLVMMLRKSTFERIIIIILGLGVHSLGFILLLAWFFIDSFFEKKMFLSACALPTTFSTKQFLPNQNIFQKQVVTRIQDTELNFVNSYVTWSHALNLFSRVFLLPLWFFSLKELLKSGNAKYFYLLAFIVLAGFFSDQVNPLRILSLAIFPLGIGLIESYKTMESGTKKLVWLFLLCGIVLNVYSWIILKNYNYCILP